MSERKVLRMLSVLAALGAGLFVLFYIFGPSLVKSRIADATLKTEPGKYQGEEALPEGGTVLFVAAHADDLEFMAGGTLPKLLERKNQVYLVLLTDGGKQRYMPSFYSRRIVKTRREEQIKIGKAEGLSKVFFMDYPDGSLKFSEGAVEKVAKVAELVDASDIFTFEPGKREGRYDSDHDASGQIGREVARRLEIIEAVFYFRSHNPNVVIDITDTFERKLDVLFMFTETRYKRRLLRGLHEAFAGADGARIGVKYGEAFRMELPGELKEANADVEVEAGKEMELSAAGATRKVGRQN